ncbi:TPA: hypothetical protein ACH3X1_006686 [Trebouxia sp. C0004]
MILKRMKKTKSMSWAVLAVLVAETSFSESTRQEQGALAELVGVFHVIHGRSLVIMAMIRLWCSFLYILQTVQCAFVAICLQLHCTIESLGNTCEPMYFA